MPHFPPVRANPVRRFVTKHLLALRARELSGRGFGWRYYAPRALGIAILVLGILGSLFTIVAYKIDVLTPGSTLYSVRRSVERMELPWIEESVERDLWIAARRLAEFELAATRAMRQQLLRDMETALTRLDGHAMTLDAELRDRARIRARALEEEALIAYRTWGDADRPTADTSGTLVMDAAHDVPERVLAAQELRDPANATTPLALVPITELLNLADLLDPDVQPLVPRMRWLVQQGSDVSDAAVVEAYVRFVLGADDASI